MKQFSLGILPLALCGLLLTPACSVGEGPGATEDELATDGLTMLKPRRQLIRLSVDLRGTHPTALDLHTIETTPELYEQYVDRFLDGERFPYRLREMFNAAFLTRTGESFFDPDEAGITGVSNERVAESDWRRAVAAHQLYV